MFSAWKILHQIQILSLEINVLDDTMACRTSVWHNNTSIIGNQCMPVPHYYCTLYCILSRGLTSSIFVMRSCCPFLMICFQGFQNINEKHSCCALSTPSCMYEIWDGKVIEYEGGPKMWEEPTKVKSCTSSQNTCVVKIDNKRKGHLCHNNKISFL